MNKTLTWVIVIVIVIVGGYYLFFNKKEPFDAAQGEPIKIGIIAPLTGPGAIFGNSLVKAIEMAQEDLGKTKNKYEVIIEDDGTNPGQSASAAKKLIEIDKVKAIISATSGTGNAIKPLAAAGKVIQICIGCADLSIGDGTYNYTNAILPAEDAAFWADEAAKRGLKKVAILSQIHPGINVVVDEIKNQASLKGLSVVYEERFDGSVRDFKTIIAKAKISNPDTYFIISFPPSIDIIGQELRTLGVKQVSTIAGFAISANPEIFNDYWFVDAYIADPSFLKRFRERYPEIRLSPRTGPHSYDTFTMLVKGFESGKEISQYLTELTEYTGIVGETIKAIGSGNFSSKPAAWIMKNGRPEPIE